MERIERLVRSYIVSENSEEELDSVVSDISDGKATLLHVVKALGDFLTAEDEAVRTKGVGLLSDVLTKCPPNKVNGQSARVLTTFYCDKLDDTETIIPALKGLVPLVSNPSFAPEDVVTTTKAIFRHVSMRVHVQSTRHRVFTIMDTFMARHREALKKLGDEFLRGYIELAEGEKDPQNLLLAFSIGRVILIEFDITHHVDDLFNVTFCYFPISFRPPPDDPYGITPDDLKMTLRSCLNATPLFGPLAMPLFLEKLSAGSGSTKRDTMQTIASCLPVYGVVVARDHVQKMWSAFKLEIFQPIDAETADCALETVQTLIQVVYPMADKAVLDEAPEGLGKHIVEECLEVLKEPEKSKAKPAIEVLAALVRTTPFITRYTVSQTIPHLIGLFRNLDEISNRPAILTALGTMVQAIRDVYNEKNNTGDVRSYEAEKPLDAVKDELLGVFTVGLKNAASTSPALIGLEALVKVPKLLTDEEVGFVVHSVNEVLSAGEDIGDDVRAATLEVLSSVSLISPKHIEETTLPLLFSSLPDTAPSREADLERARYRRILASLSKLCIQPPLFETLVIRLSTKLDLVCESNASLVDTETNAAYAHAMLSNLSTVLADKVSAGHADMPKYLDRLVPRIYNLFIAGAISGEQNAAATVATHPRLIQIAAKVVAQIVQTVPVARQQTFADSLFKAWFDGEVRAVADGHQSLPSETSAFAPFDIHASATQKGLIPLFSAPVVTFHKDVRLPVDDEAALLSTLLSWCLDISENEVQAIAVMHTVASMVNKHTEGLSAFVTLQVDSFWNHNLVDQSTSLGRRRRAVRVWTWITKALVVRNHDKVHVYVDKLFSLFNDETLAWDAAKAIGDIGSGGESVLTKKNFAVLRILSAQKYVNSVLPRIVAGARSTDNASQQTAYLVALASLIKSISKNMYAHEMPKLMPLVLRGLDLPDVDMRADVIETVSSAAKDVSTSGEAVQASISEYAPSIVTAMLRNCRTQELTSSRLRKAALRCLGILPRTVRYDILHPSKSQVIRELGKCLDDPVREVRKEAVDARENWYRYSG